MRLNIYYKLAVCIASAAGVGIISAGIAFAATPVGTGNPAAVTETAPSTTTPDSAVNADPSQKTTTTTPSTTQTTSPTSSVTPNDSSGDSTGTTPTDTVTSNQSQSSSSSSTSSSTSSNGTSGSASSGQSGSGSGSSTGALPSTTQIPAGSDNSDSNTTASSSSTNNGIGDISTTLPGAPTTPGGTDTVAQVAAAVREAASTTDTQIGQAAETVATTGSAIVVHVATTASPAPSAPNKGSIPDGAILQQLGGGIAVVRDSLNNMRLHVVAIVAGTDPLASAILGSVVGLLLMAVVSLFIDRLRKSGFMGAARSDASQFLFSLSTLHEMSLVTGMLPSPDHFYYRVTKIKLINQS
jgi:hypothetical protein